jgi:hypothetical protein
MMQELSLAQGTLSPSFSACLLHNFSDTHNTLYYALTILIPKEKLAYFDIFL